MRYFTQASIFVSILLFGVTSMVSADEQTFPEGSLIIPMDTDYQDDGMFTAFGLLNQLLLADITVYWVIAPDKEIGDDDFEADAVDVSTEAVIDEHGYRGGPFVIHADDATAAMDDVIEDWPEEHNTTVHRTTSSFDGNVSRILTAAPTIAVFADGNEQVAFRYLNAAAIPDSRGIAWPLNRDRDGEYPGYVDILNVEQVHGDTEEVHDDGALFDELGIPLFCQVMTMHWGVDHRDEGAIAEFHRFLAFPTHFFAECQAVNAVENAENGHWLTYNGYDEDFGDKPDDVVFHNSHLPFAQMDGEWGPEGGSEPSFSLPEGDVYRDEGVVMITDADTPLGVNDIWMTGYVDGDCLIDPKEPDEECDELIGKVSYLGGHEYSTRTPISEHPESQGTRLFLNSLFEADCVSTVGQPVLEFTLEGPHHTIVAEVEYIFTYENVGAGIALDLTLTDTLPEGMSFVASSPSPTSNEGGVITWALNNVAAEDEGQIELTVNLDDEGVYRNQGRIGYRVALNHREVVSNRMTTMFNLGGEFPPDLGEFVDIGTDGDNDGGGVDDMGTDGQRDGEIPGDAETDFSVPDTDADDDSGAVHVDGTTNPDGSSAGVRAGEETGSEPEDGCDCRTVRESPMGWPPFALLLMLLLRRRQSSRR